MNIGEKLRALRKSKKLPQEALAEFMNVSPQAVSKWETGASSPDIDMLPTLAAFYETTVDDLLDFDRRRINAEVDAIVTQSVPLRSEPEKAEAFYREALKKYPNNEVLLNCLLMVIPNERLSEKLELGERLLESSADDEIRLDVLRLLALSCRASGERRMAEHYLSRLPELYFLKTEVAAAILEGEEQKDEIRKTEDVCLWTLCAMIKRREAISEDGARFSDLFDRVIDLFRAFPEYAPLADRVDKSLRDADVNELYM